VSAEKVGQGVVESFSHRVKSTWLLRGLAEEWPWLTLGGPFGSFCTKTCIHNPNYWKLIND